MNIQRIIGASLALVGCLAASSNALAQQTVTYPDPSFSNATFQTTLDQTMTFAGCPPNYDPTSSSSPETEYIFAPFFFANGFPNSESAPSGPSGPLPFTLSKLLTLVNGNSGYQGAVTLSATSGVYPATQGSGVGDAVTYTISVGGNVVTEQVSANVQGIGFGAGSINE